jgi:cysteinyl-tRNA synthetase
MKRLRDLGRVRSWAPVFGGADASHLDSYDLVVLDCVGDKNGSQVSATDLRTLHGADVLVVSYLSVGTVEDWRPYAELVPDSWTLADVEDWPGERYVNAAEPGWQEMMETEALGLAARGVDGLYLDNLDVAEDFPSTRRGVINLVRKLRGAVPEMLLITQNGLTVADELPIDAIAHEDTYWRWDGGYRPSSAKETAAIVRRLRRLRGQGLPVLTLDYTPARSDAAGDVVARSLAEGFIPAVSVLELDRPPHAGATR